ncbi:Two-component response regulator [Nymphaea thermarum]|nr:Two-component response regulator [Nymphaea thermarum]
MGSPLELNLDYKPPAKKKGAGLSMEQFVGGDGGGLEDRLKCLEEERKKIDAFKRELPLCMQLVNEAIENVKQQMKQQCRMGRPVLEEFIPVKKFSSDEVEKGDGFLREEKDCRDKMNWMRSAQLWSDNHLDSPDMRNERMDEESVQSANSHKFSVNRSRGAFLHFKENSAFAAASKEEKEVSADLSLSTESKPNCGAQSSSPVQSGAQSQQAQRKARRCWSPELHRRFVNALQQLGGAQVATPKQIRELMKVDGLTNDEVKSHLQVSSDSVHPPFPLVPLLRLQGPNKYRLHTRRANVGPPAPAGSQQSNLLVMLGGIWVPHEYSTQGSRNPQSLKQSPAQSASPQGPLQFSGNQRVSHESREDEDDDDEETKSESYSWKGHQQGCRSEEISE